MRKTAPKARRERRRMDSSWRFHPGDIPFPRPANHQENYLYGLAKAGAFQGAAKPDYDDASWRTLDLPHDWAVEGDFSPEADISHGYLPLGVAWYRKRFEIPAQDAGGRLFLEFDGIFRDAAVYLNGHFIGNEPSGYITARYDITDQAIYGGQNVLAVRVDATLNEGWWYEGAGIYRHVWLLKTSELHIKPWGVFVASDVKTRKGKAIGAATITVGTELSNHSDRYARCELVSEIIDSSGSAVVSARRAATPSVSGDVRVNQKLRVASPVLWSPQKPCLYTLRSRLLKAGAVVDELETPFGVRTAVFHRDKGFLLNGLPVKLKGTSNHQDHAGVGVALPDRLHEFRIRRLKEMGSNAWRCAHNPPAPEFLDACDRLGMMVMDETRCMNSTAEGLGQLESMILRDRNHPSVVIWSLGNEEHFHQGTETGGRIIRAMKRLARRLDPTRPVTLAMNHSWVGPVSPLLDVLGINYFPDLYDDLHKRFPKLPVLATETSPAFCTRGIHVNDPERGHFDSYDTRKAPKEWTHCITTEEAWKAVAQRDFIAGIFPWTGFDYRGEPAPFEWPCVLTNMGLLDLCGFPKDHFYYHQAWWTDQPVLHIFPHWNWPGREGQVIDVWCYSNCERVELFLNGAGLGAQEMPRNGHLEWKVQYAPGTLCARGFSKGTLEIESRIETTGSPASLQIQADRDTIQADGRDVSIMTVSALDDAGRPVPDAGNAVAFEVAGPGRIIGTGNGDPSSHEPDKAGARRLFNGLCQLIVQGVDGQPGNIAVEARSAGLSQARCLVTTRSPRGISRVKSV